MASKSQLAGEIRSKDQTIQRINSLNNALNERLTKMAITRGNLEKEVHRLQVENAELKKKRWFEFWK